MVNRVFFRFLKKDAQPGMSPPIGKNVLELRNIRDSANYTCVAASKLGIIEAHTFVRVQGEREIPDFMVMKMF